MSKNIVHNNGVSSGNEETPPVSISSGRFSSSAYPNTNLPSASLYPSVQLTGQDQSQGFSQQYFFQKNIQSDLNQDLNQQSQGFIKNKFQNLGQSSSQMQTFQNSSQGLNQGPNTGFYKEQDSTQDQFFQDSVSFQTSQKKQQNPAREQKNFLKNNKPYTLVYNKTQTMQTGLDPYQGQSGVVGFSESQQNTASSVFSKQSTSEKEGQTSKKNIDGNVGAFYQNLLYDQTQKTLQQTLDTQRQGIETLYNKPQLIDPSLNFQNIGLQNLNTNNNIREQSPSAPITRAQVGGEGLVSNPVSQNNHNLAEILQQLSLQFQTNFSIQQAEIRNIQKQNQQQIQDLNFKFSEFQQKLQTVGPSTSQTNQVQTDFQSFTKPEQSAFSKGENLIDIYRQNQDQNKNMYFQNFQANAPRYQQPVQEPSFYFPAQKVERQPYSEDRQGQVENQGTQISQGYASFPRKQTSYMDWEYSQQPQASSNVQSQGIDQYQPYGQYGNPPLQSETQIPPEFQGSQPLHNYYKASPAQFVQISDIKNYQKGEDMRFYLQKFDNSFIGMVPSDATKIIRLINKLQDVESVYLFAAERKHYNSYEYFKKALLDKYSKDEDALLRELENMVKEPNETYSDFLDRMYVKVNIPHIAVNMTFYTGEMYRKLPKDFQRLIKKSTVKTFERLKEQVEIVESSPLYQQISYLTQQVKKGGREKDSNQGGTQKQSYQSSPSYNRGNYGGRGGPNPGRGGPNPGRSYQGRAGQNQSQQHQALMAQYDQTEGEHSNQEGEKQEYEIPQVQSDNGQEQNYATYLGSLESIPEEENETSDSENDREIFSTFPAETRTMKRGKVDRPMEPEINQNNTIRMGDVETVQRGFTFLDYKRPTVNEIQKQVIEAQLSGRCRCLIDKGLFRDGNGSIQLSRLKESFEISLTISELEQMMEQHKAGHLPIYFEQIQEDSKGILKDICDSVQISNASQKIAAKVSKAGKLKMLNVQLDKHQIAATMDTGAVKTLVSANVVEHFKLHSFVQNYRRKPVVRGVAGNMYIDSFLKSIPIFFKEQCIWLDIPIIQTQEFQLLLASNVLDEGLEECIIDFHRKEFSFKSEISQERITMPMYVYERQKQYPIYNVNSIDSKVEQIWPRILQFPFKFDLALIDLPFEQVPTPYCHTKVPYQTSTMKELETFGLVLNTIMNQDCVMLFWVSCKRVEDVLYLLNVWGFKYFNVLLVWAKLLNKEQLQMGLGFWSRNNVELLIMSKRGKIGQFKSKKKNVSQLFYTLFDKAKTREHSSKPTKVYDLINEIFNINDLNCIEIFARQKDSLIQQEQFCLYGNEISDFIQIPVKYQTQGNRFVSLMGTLDLENSNQSQSDQNFKDFIDMQDMEPIYKKDPKIISLFKKHFDIFDFQGQVGLAKNYQLDLRLKPGSKAPKSRKPIYDQEQLEVLRLTIKDWQSKDLIIDGHSDYVFYPVIVKKRGVPDHHPLNKRYRVCFNFQPLNEVLEDEEFLQMTSEEIIAQGAEANFMAVVDLVMAHQQIGVSPSQWYLMGLWTPEGIKLSKRGQFGILPIAKVFSKALDKAIGHLKPWVRAYADDITIFAKNLNHLIELLDQVFQALKDNGFILSHKKGKYFKTQLNILGQIVGNGQVRIDPKRIDSLRALPSPKTKKDMQRFIGLLSYLRKFIPNLTTLLQPLYKSINVQEFNFNDLQLQVFKQLKYIVTSDTVLQLPNINKRFYISISFSNLGYGACLFQQYENKFRPVAYRSKSLEVPDFNKPQFYLKLKALTQAIKEWRKWIISQKVIIITDNKILYHALNFSGENQVINNLQSKLFDIDIQVQIKPETFKPLKYSQVLCDAFETKQLDTLDLLLQEYELSQEQNLNEKKDVQQFSFDFEKFDYTAMFDGACSRKLKTRTIGIFAWVLFDSQGQQLFHEAGEVISEQHQITNNFCENSALLQFLLYLQKENIQFSKLRIIGDSQLTIKQLKGQYRVNNNGIRSIQRTVKEILRKYRYNIILCYAPRKFNTIADQYAQEMMKTLLKTQVTNQLDIRTFTVIDFDPVDAITCQICGQKSENETMYLCDACGYGQHKNCIGEPIEPVKDYFFCKNCDVQLFEVHQHSPKDLTQDFAFLEYLQDPKTFEKSEPSVSRKFGHLAKFYTFEANSLFFKTSQGLKRVPSVTERVLIMAQIHSNLGHPSISTTTKAIMQDFYWPNLVSQVNQFVKKCALCQARKSHYLPMSNVFPTTKGMSVWQYVSIDLIEIRKKEDGPERYIFSAICNFCKAPELVPLTDKTAKSTAQAFADQILYRYGCPLVVRTDTGGEFEAEFTQLLDKCHILHVRSSPRYPQSNGLIERLNETIKSKLQALYNDEAYNDKWMNLVQLIAFSIRISISRSTSFSPFQIMYGRDCRLPGIAPQLPHDTFIQPTSNQIIAYVDHLLKTLGKTESKVKTKLQEMDEEIRSSMEAKTIKKIIDLPFCQPIFVKSTDATKLNLGVEGICYFVRYVNPVRRDTILYYNPKSAQFLKANISNVKICNLQQ